MCKTEKPPETKSLFKTLVADEIFFVDEFLSGSECNEILEELDVAAWQPSSIYQRQKNGRYRNVLSSFRLSDTAHQEWFSDELNVLLSRIEKRLKTLVELDTATLESWQATEYPRKGKLDYHLDSGYGEIITPATGFALFFYT